MTAPSTAALREVLWPHPDTIVLRSRRLHPAADTTRLSRFRDDVWVLSAADVDDYHRAPSLYFIRVPAPLRTALKAFALAVLDHPWPDQLAAGTDSEVPSLATLYSWCADLRPFAAWIHERGMTQISQVTAEDLDVYRAHVLAVMSSGSRRADHLQAVRVLWAYRAYLPAECRLPSPRPWGEATARQMAGQTHSSRYNTTPRIQPDTMEALLAWCLRVLEDFGPDIRDAYRTHRELKAGTHPTARHYREHFHGRPVLDRIEHYLSQLRATGEALPGKRGPDGSVQLACAHLAKILACGGGRIHSRVDTITAMARTHGVAIAPQIALGTIRGRLDGRPWRDRPISPEEIDWLMRALRTAAFVTICYLSGMRPGEALNLRRHCLRQDENGHFTLVGRPSKGTVRQGADAAQRSWAVVSVVASAVTMLESLTDSPLLFPPSFKRLATRPIEQARPLQSGLVNADVAQFIEWINITFAGTDGALLIPPDPHPSIYASRFRRTLAYFVVRRPGGLIAAALQYGHINSKVTLGYAGASDTSWLDDVTVERLQMVIDQNEEDLRLLSGGEHISGPSSIEYSQRLQHTAAFTGRVVDKVRNAERLLKAADPNIHHGQGMTCVYRPETALCRTARLEAGLSADGPEESGCRSACTNLVYTDRDIDHLRRQHTRLITTATDDLSPRPLRERARTQADRLTTLITHHESTRSTNNTAQEGR
ncbi:hypothetical protein [Streptomyces sp. NPDC004296]|uniref:hypothetical protein n=1 Tax=Streptomyces sp. NPDC004296 TaxID=3364697 RepID=UPI00367BB469